MLLRHNVYHIFAFILAMYDTTYLMYPKPLIRLFFFFFLRRTITLRNPDKCTGAPGEHGSDMVP